MSRAKSAALAAGLMEDRHLVERSQAGEMAAFEELVRRYQDGAYAIAYRLLGHREDAQDVAQEAFARAYFRLADFRGSAQFRTWLYRILVNLATDFLRRRKPEVPEGEIAPSLERSGENLVKDLERKELRQSLDKAIKALPSHLRTVIVLREQVELSYAEIAEVIRRPVGTVMSRLFYARHRLRDSLTV